MPDYHKVLCLDDDPSMLRSLERALREHGDVRACENPLEALEILEKDGPFALVISDYRMPTMNGIAFLRQVERINPDTIRVMLTAYADQQTAISAVNDGHVFRFLDKPCDADFLDKTVKKALKQYDLVTAEKQLLEHTLKQTIRVLTDILEMTNVLAFSRGRHMREYARQIALMLHLPNVWEIEIAALLSQIGYVTVPNKTLDRFYSGQQLNSHELQMISQAPEAASNLLSQIPRMENIAQMIQRHTETINFSQFSSGEAISVGAAILKVAFEVDVLLARGNKLDQIREKIEKRSQEFPAKLVDCVSRIEVLAQKMIQREISVNDLKNGMILGEDVLTYEGVLIVSEGFRVNETVRQRLKNFLMEQTIPERISVLIPV